MDMRRRLEQLERRMLRHYSDDETLARLTALQARAASGDAGAIRRLQQVNTLFERARSRVIIYDPATMTPAQARAELASVLPDGPVVLLPDNGRDKKTEVSMATIDRRLTTIERLLSPVCRRCGALLHCSGCGEFRWYLNRLIDAELDELERLVRKATAERGMSYADY
jgi:hypothetical protein